jgi:hypothetical protein
MKKNFLILVIVQLVFILTLEAQQKNDKSSSFISGLVGAAKINNSNVDGTNPVSFVFGGSFGVPLTGNLFLYTRSSYSSKSNFQSYYNTSFMLDNFQSSGGLVEVNSSFSQLLLNGGLLYNIPVTKEFTFGINGGLTFMVINQEARLREGTVISSIDNENIWGAFGGLIVEKTWKESDFTTFFEAQYNYANTTVPLGKQVRQ